MTLKLLYSWANLNLPFVSRVFHAFFRTECPQCDEYLRHVQSFAPGAPAVLALLVVLVFFSSVFTCKRRGRDLRKRNSKNTNNRHNGSCLGLAWARHGLTPPLLPCSPSPPYRAPFGALWERTARVTEGVFLPVQMVHMGTQTSWEKDDDDDDNDDESADSSAVRPSDKNLVDVTCAENGSAVGAALNRHSIYSSFTNLFPPRGTAEDYVAMRLALHCASSPSPARTLHGCGNP